MQRRWGLVRSTRFLTHSCRTTAGVTRPLKTMTSTTARRRCGSRAAGGLKELVTVMRTSDRAVRYPLEWGANCDGGRERRITPYVVAGYEPPTTSSALGVALWRGTRGPDRFGQAGGEARGECGKDPISPGASRGEGGSRDRTGTVTARPGDGGTQPGGPIVVTRRHAPAPASRPPHVGAEAGPTPSSLIHDA